MALSLLERHPLGSQAFMPLSQLPYLVVVAPPADASRPDLAHLRCFATGPGQGVNYAAGTWHHPLLALQAECDFLVVDRGGAASDHNCDEFALEGLGLWLAVGPNTPESFSSQGVA
jgi:ureidoglycolate lyase